MAPSRGPRAPPWGRPLLAAPPWAAFLSYFLLMISIIVPGAYSQLIEENQMVVQEASGRLDPDEYPVDRRRSGNYTKGTPASKVYSHWTQSPMRGDVGFLKVVASYQTAPPPDSVVAQMEQLPGLVPGRGMMHLPFVRYAPSGRDVSSEV